MVEEGRQRKKKEKQKRGVLLWKELTQNGEG
jgi:hypothetical protein